ncbi:MAG: hypothetical protein IKL70_01765 [Oscillospiraceae bacterium]|nr:hypothetical protein [Oscillospiraceae bacterium]
MRQISSKFIEDLKDEYLSYFLNQVKTNHHNLCLEIRSGYINIYYRGGNLLRIKKKRNGYEFHFDSKYCSNKKDTSNYNHFCSLNSNSAQDYIENFNLMMAEMDSWLEEHPKAEREFQHKLLVNNPSIIDIEYVPPKSKTKRMRLDMLMIHGDKLIIVENKFGTKSISGKAGLKEHYKDMCALLNDSQLIDVLLKSVENIAKTKYELGLLQSPIPKIDESKIEILFLLADYNEKSKTLNKELNSIENITHPIKLLKMSSSNYNIDMSKAQYVEKNN